MYALKTICCILMMMTSCQVEGCWLNLGCPTITGYSLVKYGVTGHQDSPMVAACVWANVISYQCYFCLEFFSNLVSHQSVSQQLAYSGVTSNSGPPARKSFGPPALFPNKIGVSTCMYINIKLHVYDTQLKRLSIFSLPFVA